MNWSKWFVDEAMISLETKTIISSVKSFLANLSDQTTKAKLPNYIFTRLGVYLVEVEHSAKELLLVLSGKKPCSSSIQ